MLAGRGAPVRRTPGLYASTSCDCFSSDCSYVQNLRRKGVKIFIISSGTRDIIPKLFRPTEGALQTASLVFYSPEAIAHSSKWREVLEDAAVSGCVCAVVINESIW